jgi:hypothetical protein
MRHLLLILNCVFVSAAYADTTATDAFNNNIKTKIKSETALLKKDLRKLSDTVSTLKSEKSTLSQAVKNMESWGREEQRQKLEYYKLAEEYKEAYDASSLKLEKEKQEHEKTLHHYHKVKKIMGLLAGLLLMFIYLRLGSSLIAPLLGPYAPLATILGPAAAFAIGFAAVYFAF